MKRSHKNYKLLLYSGMVSFNEIEHYIRFFVTEVKEFSVHRAEPQIHRSIIGVLKSKGYVKRIHLMLTWFAFYGYYNPLLHFNESILVCSNSYYTGI